LSELGHGGMGVVYKARQDRLKRLVALKMLLPGSYAGDAELARFRAEAEAVARLQHPNIIQIYEIGEAEGRPFFSLEFAEGGSLAKKLHGTPLPSEEAARVVEIISRAVDAAHQRGVVHRDLKPANILLARSDPIQGIPLGSSPDEAGHYQLKVSDFGLAKQLDVESGQTQTGAILGTPSYMAPEQAAGKTHEIGPAADIYALGAVLYELLTGRPPFKAASQLDTVMQVVNEEPVPPSRLQSRVACDLETICLKCLEKEPKKRYGSAKDLAEELARFQKGEPIRARPVGRAERLWRWSRRNPRVAALAGTAAALLVLVAVVASAGYLIISAALKETREARENEARQKLAAEGARDQARKDRDRVNGLLYLANLRHARRAWERGDLGQLRQLLDLLRPEPGWTDHRGWEWYYLQAQCRGHLVGLHGHTGPVTQLAWSPDGKLLASAAQDKTVRVWEVATGQELYVLKTDLLSFQMGPVVWSPDGKRLAVDHEDGKAQIVDATTGRKQHTLDAGGTASGSLRLIWSPDGKRLATLGGFGKFILWDTSTGKSVVNSADYINELAWSPDGRRLVTTTRGKVHIRDGATGKEIWEVPGPAFGAREVVWKPNGRQLAIATGLGGWKVLDVDGKRAAFSLPGKPAWSADGRHLAAGNDNGTIQIVNAADGQALSTLGERTGSGRQPLLTWGPDGRRLLSQDHDIHILWDTARGKKICELPHGLARLDWRPKSPWLAYQDGGAVRLWDSATGQELLSLPGLARDVLVFSREPNGDRLACGNRTGAINLWRMEKGPDAVRSIPIPPGLSSPVAAGSPDGRRLALAGAENSFPVRNAVRVLALATGRVTQSLGEQGSIPGQSTWSPDGRRLAALVGIGEIRIWDVATGKVARQLRGRWKWAGRLLWSPDSRRLALTGGDPAAEVWDVATGKLLLSVAAAKGAGWVLGVAWSPDSRRLAAAGGPGMVQVWDVEKGKVSATLEGHGQAITALAWSRAGRLAVAGQGNVLKVWDVAGKKPVNLAGKTQGISLLVWSPDGRRLFAGRGGQGEVWDTSTAKLLFAVRSAGWIGQPPSPVWSADGRRLAAVGATGTLEIWDAIVGKKAVTLGAAQSAVQLSPDGKRMACLADDDSLHIWDAARGLRTVSGGKQLARFALLAWSPNSQVLVWVRLDGSCLFWDAETGKEICTFRGGRASNLLALSPDGSKFTAAQGDQILKVWDRKTNKPVFNLATIRSAGSHVSAAWSPDGKKVAATIALDGTLQVWNATTGKEIRKLPQGRPWIIALAWSPDSRRLALLKPEGSVWVVDVSTGKDVRTPLPPSEGGTTCACLAWSPDGKRLAAATVNNRIILWDSTTGKLQGTLRGPGPWLASLAWSASSKRLVAASSTGVVEVLDVVTGRRVKTLREPAGRVSWLAWTPDGRRLISGSPDMGFKLWDTRTGQPVPAASWQPPAFRLIPDQRVAWEPGSLRLAVAAHDGTVQVWDSASGREVGRLRGRRMRQSDQVQALTWAPAGKCLAVSHADGLLEIWDPASVVEPVPLGEPPSFIHRLAWSPDGRRLAAGRDDGSIKVWHAGGLEIATLRWRNGAATALAWSGEGKHLAWGSKDGAVLTWAAATGRRQVVPGAHPAAVESLAWGPDGRLATASEDGTVKLWETTTPNPVRTLRGPQHGGGSDDGVALAWSPDGGRLAAASPRGPIAIWKSGTWKETVTLRGHRPGEVRWLGWSPDGRRLFSAGGEASRIWDAATGEELLTLPGLVALDLSSDGRRLLATGGNTIRIWDPMLSEPRP
jgi:WD40 repeat protein